MISVGDTVELFLISRWGGLTPTGRMGIVLKQAYLAYESKNSKWEVMLDDGTVHKIEESRMRCRARAT